MNKLSYVGNILTIGEHGLQVETGVGGVRGLELELVHEHLHRLGCKEGGEGRAQADLLDTEGEEREEHRDGLLLEPADVEGEGEGVDVGVEGLGKLSGHYQGAVGVIALRGGEDIPE